MEHKRLTLFAGHYGSGKTNIAVNYALALKNTGLSVDVADLDIVNPYFRAEDSKDLLEENGIELISSRYANSNIDLPALPSELYSVVSRKDRCAILDIGGDDRGAMALGRFRQYIEEENDYEMLFVANFYRPLTRLPEEALHIMTEIENACKMRFTGIINNSNLGDQTQAEDVLIKIALSQKLSLLSGLAIRMTTVKADLSGALSGKVADLFPLMLQERIYES